MHFYNTLLKDALAGLGSALNVEGRRISVRTGTVWRR
jgi:hypothetical protein